MTTYGQVIAILNGEQILLRIDENHLSEVYPGLHLTVFDSIANSELAELGLVNITAPKGAVELVLKQSDDVYLAKIFEEGGQLVDSPLSNFANLFSNKVRVGASKSALIAEDDSLGIEFSSTLKKGDLVGII